MSKCVVCGKENNWKSLCLDCRKDARKSLVKEARKGYVSLKKVEEILWSHRDTPCDCSKCQVLVCLEEIKELGNE